MAGSLLRIRRPHVEEGLRRAGIVAPAEVARGMYASLGTGLLELLWMAGRPRRPIAPLVHFSDEVLALVARCGREGKGLVVATAHTGNWDLTACAAAQWVDRGLLVITQRLRVAALDRFWQSSRAGRGVRLVEPEGAFATGRRFLREEAGIAAVLIDQAPERASGVAEISFFGRRARADLTAPLLALRSKVPLALVLGCRLPDGRHAVELKCVLEPPEGAGRAWAEHAMRVLSGELETFVRAHPEQWLWLHRRWKGPSPAGRRAPRLEGRLSPSAVSGKPLVP